MANEGRSKIMIENFGPIIKGEIELNPLTIFIGPNNSGKSYTATLIHSLYTSFYRLGSPYMYYALDHETREKPIEIGGPFKREEDILEKGEEWISEHKEEIIRTAKEIMTEEIKKEIESSYSSKIDNLVRIGEKTFRIEMNQNSNMFVIENSKDNLKVVKSPPVEVPDIRTIAKAVGGYGKTVHSLSFRLADVLIVLFRETFREFSRPTHYLPASRSGILQTYKALMSGVIESIPYMGLERLNMPRLSKIVSNLVSTIIDMPSGEGPLFRLACELEEEILSGNIVMEGIGRYRYLEIKYEYMDTLIPLQRASSTVSELAPLVLYLKYVIKPGDTLIIEEPESHLHPQNQSILAKYFVKLIKKDVNLIITTHSEFLLEKLSNFIMLSSVDEQKRIEKYRCKEFLQPGEISVYLFKPDQKGGNTIEEVEITKEGISQEEFLRVHESLYDETYKLRMDIGD